MAGSTVFSVNSTRRWEDLVKAWDQGEPLEAVLGPVVLVDVDDLPDPEPETPQRPRGKPVAQVRGVLADQVVVSTPLDPFLPLKALADYSGLSVRTLRGYLAEPLHPLPCYRPGGKILVRRSEFDAWMTRYRQLGRADVDHIVSEVFKEFR